MKTVFITGAAQGIGLATARHFAARGWFVGLYDINRDALRALLDSGDFPKACADHCDVTRSDSVDGALAHFAGHTDGRLDVLVNNAGVLTSGPFEEIDYQHYESIIDVNVQGLTRVAQAAFPLLRDTAGSTLVNLCSASSIYGVPLLAVYSASKFYVDGFTQALNLEWAPHDIRVTCVKPPLVNTEMGHAVSSRLMTHFSVDMQPPEVAKAIEQAVQGRRVGYVLGGTTRLWGFLDKFLPERARRALTRRLTGY